MGFRQITLKKNDAVTELTQKERGREKYELTETCARRSSKEIVSVLTQI